MFSNRIDAGQRLAARLGHLRGPDTVVVGLPRGGVPVAAEVARQLGAPLDVILVRKLGVPFQPELGMGAIGEDGVRVINTDIVRMVGVDDQDVANVEARERVELQRRSEMYRRGRARVPLGGRTVVVVDDGVATGSTARAACQVARAEGATRVVLAVPVAPTDWKLRLAGEADEFVALTTPSDFSGVGQFYRDFSQTTDHEVTACLDRANASPRHPRPRDEDVRIDVGGAVLGGHLTVPADATGIVIFAHGSGSSRHSPRNCYVASVLNGAGLATLLFDLLTPAEENDRANVFDIELLGRRLAEVTRVVAGDADFGELAVGFFGASTGAAAALYAAADPGTNVAAVVSRGGRPDLAGSRLGAVRAPTLLIVGGRDDQVLELNEMARRRLRCESDLVVVPGATHLFEEPGTLEAAAGHATDWFLRHF
ncbi:MAG TPA: phosphoribosyltransferase family protein [Ilumatobacteraceae bacterium]|nr:phosphoribosyltransferase family protein [Ilumatobacteraceae bacterium]